MKTNQYLILLAVLSALAAVTTGCGGGNRPHRQRISRDANKATANAKGAKTTTPQGQQQPGGAAPGNAGPQGSNPNSTGTGARSPVLTETETKAKAASEERIKGIWTDLAKDANPVNGPLPDGRYVLQGTAAGYKNMVSDQWVLAAQVFSLNSGNPPQLAPTNVGESSGIMKNESDPGRLLEIPAAFTVSRGQATAELAWKYRTQLISEGTKVTLSDRIFQLDQGDLPSVLKIINGQTPGGPVTVEKKEVLQTGDGGIRVILTLAELPNKIYRTVAFFYKFENGRAPGTGLGGPNEDPGQPQAPAGLNGGVE